MVAHVQAAAKNDYEYKFLELPHYEAGAYECLLLEPVDAKPGYFRRFGYVDVTKTTFRWTPETPEEIAMQDRAMWRLLDGQFHDVPEQLYHSVDDDFMYAITLV